MSESNCKCLDFYHEAGVGLSTDRHSCLLCICRSTTLLTDGSGAVVNRYDYEPFGTPTVNTEGMDNMYQFVGQWGVRKVPELKVCLMHFTVFKHIFSPK